MRLFIACSAFLLLSACWDAGAGAPVFEARTGIVYDGDSFLVKRGRNEIEIRLYGIDAPEKAQPWSAEARKALDKLIGGRMLRIDPVETDRYDRIVARVYRADDDLYVNAEMIRQGHAWVYRRYTDERKLLASEKLARRDDAGLWGLPGQQRQAPWDWRAEHP
ncbi:MAG: nuclease [Gammaproteobacteria bacterium]|nr:nuclease [Gammaproteobacteria bacterium]